MKYIYKINFKKPTGQMATWFVPTAQDAQQKKSYIEQMYQTKATITKITNSLQLTQHTQIIQS